MSADVTLSNSPLHPHSASSSALWPTSESMSLLTQHYAIPLHQHSAHYDNNNYLNPGEHASRPENTLRRKTPNGTLNAGYEASADHSAPPLKHHLRPLGEIHRVKATQSTFPSDKRTFLQHQQHQQLQHQNGVFGSWNGASSIAWQPNQVHQNGNAFPVMDSMLNQGFPLQHFGHHQFYGQTVPSVIQPSCQYVGPTASGGQGAGPYGPYWHDGTFVPYRPAALRDPRFYHHPVDMSGSMTSPQLNFQPGLWQQPNQSPWTPAALSPFAPPTLNRPAYPQPSILHGFTPSAHGMSNESANRSILRHSVTSADVSRDVVSVEVEYGPSSINGRHRDRTFSWALQQYRDLLGFIHQARRQQQQTRNATGQQTVPHRPSFYPKPPRPSASGSLQLSRLKTDTETLRRRRDEDPPLDATDHDSVSHDDTDDNDTPKVRSSSVWTNHSIQSNDIDLHRRSSHDQYSKLPQSQFPGPQFEQNRMPRRPDLSSIPSAHSPLPQDDSPPARAAVALTQLTELCRETDWQWIDGMHLGGCLAYGLGSYQRALRWYSKVLERDPKHLEATSNLAATLLALGQRQEAEKRWVQVLKAAPNHFEAVEHLVGLLCNDQRSQEAIKVIEYVERALRLSRSSETLKPADHQSECSSSTASRSPCTSEKSDTISYDFERDGSDSIAVEDGSEPGFGSSGFAIPGCDSGRILALIHAKGNMLYGLGDNSGAARAFEDAVLIATGRMFDSIQGLVKHILTVVSTHIRPQDTRPSGSLQSMADPLLLPPDEALNTAKLCFPSHGELPGLRHVAGGHGLARKAVISTTSNSLLSLAKIFQDSMSHSSRSTKIAPLAHGVRDILALYYLSLALQPSPSTANNVGILLASVQQTAPPAMSTPKVNIPGVVPGSGIALALQYYNYGLLLDQNHAHLYTNLGSLLKDIGQLDAAINMYERAVKCDGKFDIALANLANAVKDKGRISDAIGYYKRAVEVSPEFAEAVCGLANALNSVCGWQARGGIASEGGKRDRWHVDGNGMLLDAKQTGASSSGWIKRVVDIVGKQLCEGEKWGSGALTPEIREYLIHQMCNLDSSSEGAKADEHNLRETLVAWAGKKWEGARVTRLIERNTRRVGWQWYQDTYVKKRPQPASAYVRAQLPPSLTVPTAPTVLPFHTFTCPMSAKQIRQISQRNGLRISVGTLRSPWLPKTVYPPPSPPQPYLRVGYVSSDFNNHPLAHLMQSVFGLHDTGRVKAYCYATTASDDSIHRQQIKREAPVFRDASPWSVEKLVHQIVQDEIHILVNLNGYTRGARNEVFAARPAPIQMSFMGFAGTLGAEWCDYLLADETAVPVDTLRPWRGNVNLQDQLVDDSYGGDNEDWVYGENIIYCRDSFFCCDHKQSAPDAHETNVSWEEEQKRRWKMRKELFPRIPDDTIIFGNFNQLYKIDPTTFRTWLRILARVPNSILWLLRFPDLGESHLLNTARMWAGAEVASRVVFTDVAPKHMHISRARVCDLVIDTAECNAHTTAADVLWSGTPLLTLPRYPYKMCSRMAASILKGALPKTREGLQAAKELVAMSEEDYEEKAVALGQSFSYEVGGKGIGHGRLSELRKMLFHARRNSALFDTKRWVRDLEDAYDEAWRRWVSGEGGDIWLDQVPRGKGT